MYSLVLYNIDMYSVELCGKLGFGWGEAAAKDPSQLNTHPRLHCPFSEDHTSLLLVLDIIITKLRLRRHFLLHKTGVVQFAFDFLVKML